MVRWFSNFKIQRKLALSFFFVSLVTSGLITVIFYHEITLYLKTSIQNQLKEIAALAAMQINGDEHAQIQTAEDMSGPAYLGTWADTGAAPSRFRDFSPTTPIVPLP